MENFHIEEYLNDKFIITYDIENDLVRNILCELSKFIGIINEDQLYIGKLFDNYVIICNHDFKLMIENLFHKSLAINESKYRIIFRESRRIINGKISERSWIAETDKDSKFLPLNLRIIYFGISAKFIYEENDPLIHIYRIIMEKIKNISEVELQELVIEF